MFLLPTSHLISLVQSLHHITNSSLKNQTLKSSSKDLHDLHDLHDPQTNQSQKLSRPQSRMVNEKEGEQTE